MKVLDSMSPTFAEDISQGSRPEEAVGKYYRVSGREGTIFVQGITPPNSRGERGLKILEYTEVEAKEVIAMGSNLVVGGDRGVPYGQLERLTPEEIEALTSKPQRH